MQSYVVSVLIAFRTIILHDARRRFIGDPRAALFVNAHGMTFITTESRTMTTFDDDFMRVHTDAQTSNHMAKNLGFEWPPPERIAMDVFDLGGEVVGSFREANNNDTDSQVYLRERVSAITDDERKKMTRVCRGSEYFPATWTRKQIERYL